MITFALQLQINTQKDTTQHDAIESAITSIITQFRRQDGITAKSAVVFLLESTCLLPGVFNVQMLSWRQNLQDIIHSPAHFVGFSNLQYKLPRNFEAVNDLPQYLTVASQTSLTSPNSSSVLEFQKRQYELKWTLNE